MGAEIPESRVGSKRFLDWLERTDRAVDDRKSCFRVDVWRDAGRAGRLGRVFLTLAHVREHVCMHITCMQMTLLRRTCVSR